MKYIINIFILAFCLSVVSQGQADTLNKKSLKLKLGKKSSDNQVALVSKRGINILPEAGDIAIGIDAAPIFNYIGGIFSDTDADLLAFTYGNDFGTNSGIYLKYMLEKDMAVKAKFRANFSSNSDIYAVAKSTLSYDPASPEFVDDERRTEFGNAYLSLGLEKFRGKSRVQGVYGAEVLFGYNKTKYIYNYGNSITNDFNTPDIYDNTLYNTAGERILNDYYDKGWFVGARGFIGIEFFIGPKISIGGEFGYSFVYRWSQNRISEYEYWNSGDQEVSTVYRETTLTGYQDIGVGIDQMDGSVNMYFYF